MITDVPAETPETMPVPEPMVATLVVVLLQVPPGVLDKVVVDPGHVVVIPDIGDGGALTVTVVIVMQPVGNA